MTTKLVFTTAVYGSVLSKIIQTEEEKRERGGGM